MITTDVFNSINIMLFCHVMGLDKNALYRGIYASLNEFIRKRAILYRKTAYFSVYFEDDVYALSATNPTMIATNFLKETFCLKDAIQVGCVVHEGRQTSNTVLYRMQLEIYVHAKGRVWMKF